MIGGLLMAALASAVVPDAGFSPVPSAIEKSVAPKQVRLGEPFVYLVKLRHPRTQRYELVPPEGLGAFELLEHTRERSSIGLEEDLTTFRLTTALYELGKHTLPDLKLEVNSDAGTATVVVSGEEVEAVSSLPADADAEGADLHDVKPPRDVPVRTWRLLYALGALAALAALGYGLYRYLRRPRPPALVIAPPPEPLGDRIRRQLDALAKEDLPGRGEGRQFHFRLGEILRAYLGERFSFDALDKTTPELLGELRRQRTPNLELEELRSFLEGADLVKFAKQPATAESCRAALEFCYLLVDRTLPQAAPPPGRGDGA